jgi:nucleoid-associated protein YgaU
MATKKIKKTKTKKPIKNVKAAKAVKTEKKVVVKKTTAKIKKPKEQSANQKFYDQLRLNESYVSLILGALAVVFLSSLVVFYVVNSRDSINNQRILNNAVTPTPAPEKDTYIMQEGESLWDIAVRFYGDGFSYIKIVEANKDVIGDPDFVPPGTKIIIPNL